MNTANSVWVKKHPSWVRILSAGVKAVVFATEIAVRALIVPAAAITAMSSWDIAEKTISWMQAPSKLKEIISSIPKEIEQADLLVSTVNDLEHIRTNEDDWWWEKIKQVKQIVDERLPSIVQTLKDLWAKEFKHLSDLKQWVENFKNMPTQTIASIILVISIYWLFALSLQFVRLQDKDSIWDKARKRLYYLITGKKNLETRLKQLMGEDLSEEQLITIVKLGISEHQRRQNTAPIHNKKES